MAESQATRLVAVLGLEGLNSERDLAIRGLQDAESKLMEHLLGRLKTEDPPKV